jgi:lipoate-protein ligase A
MRLKDISLSTPQENILYDNVLLELAEERLRGEVLRFWEASQPFIVLGRVSKADEDVNLRAAVEDGVPIVRRSSGGGTVVQGKGCLNYSLILSKEERPRIVDLKRSYAFILGRVIEALRRLGVNAAFHPISDIALVGNQKKISGNAQRRLRRFILHHGTILCDFDLAHIERYLAFPKSVPEYRRGRAHLDFTANISVSVHRVKEEIGRAFEADSEEPFLTGEEKEKLSLLIHASAAAG